MPWFSSPLQVTAGFPLDWRKHFSIGFCPKFWFTRLLSSCSALPKNHWSSHSWLAGECQGGFISTTQDPQHFFVSERTSNKTPELWQHQKQGGIWLDCGILGAQISLKPLLTTPWNPRKGNQDPEWFRTCSPEQPVLLGVTHPRVSQDICNQPIHPCPSVTP